MNQRGETGAGVVWAVVTTFALAIALKLLFDFNLFDYLAGPVDSVDRWLKGRF